MRFCINCVLTCFRWQHIALDIMLVMGGDWYINCHGLAYYTNFLWGYRFQRHHDRGANAQVFEVPSLKSFVSFGIDKGPGTLIYRGIKNPVTGNDPY